MFVSKHRMERAERETEYLRRELMELKWAHMRLLRALGYEEVNRAPRIDLVKKGEPEQGE